jgi:hypothetical protein
MENGHDLAYQKILPACEKYAECLRFFPSDSQDFGGLDIADSVSQWMDTAAQVSVGGRKQVLEDVADVCNSESDSDTEDHGEKLVNVFQGIPTDSAGRPLTADHKLTNDQVNAIRAVASQAASSPSSQASRMDPPPNQERKPTPMNSDDEGRYTTEEMCRACEEQG